MSDSPPQHLLGGLNVLILVAPGSSLGQLETSKASLEELGVMVVVGSTSRGPVRTFTPDGTEAQTQVAQVLSALDADAFDGLLLIADLEGARALSTSDAVLDFLVRLDREDKPIGAISEGVLPLLAAGVAAARGVSAPDSLDKAAKASGAIPQQAFLTVDHNIVSLRGEAGLAGFNDSLKKLLARRRCQTISPDNDTPSAAGEDG